MPYRIKNILCLCTLFCFALTIGFTQESVTSAVSEEPAQEATPWLRITGHWPRNAVSSEIILVFNEEVEPLADKDWLTVHQGRLVARELGPNFAVLRFQSGRDGAVCSFSINENLIGKSSGHPLAPEQRAWAFGELRLLAFEQNKYNKGSFHLLFNATILPREVAEALSVKDEAGNPIEFRIVSEPIAPVGSVYLELVSTDIQTAHFHLSGSLTDATGRHSLKAPWSESADIAPRLIFEQARIYQADMEAQVVGLTFSHAVEQQDLEKRLRLTSDGKPVRFTLLESSGEQVTLRMQAPEYGNHPITFHIEKGLTGASGSISKKPASLSVKPRVPDLSLRHGGVYAYEGKRAYTLYIYGGSFDRGELEKHLEITPPVENIEVASNGYGVRIYADWKPKQEYQAVIRKGWLIDGWYPMPQDYRFTIKPGPVKATLAFDAPEKFYFARGGRPHVILDARALKSAKLSISRMFPSNVVRAAKHINRNNKNTPSYNFVSLCAEPLSDKTIDLRYHAYKSTSTLLYLNDLLPSEQRGLFCLSATAENVGVENKLVLVTDLGALAHWDDNSLHVFVHDLRTLEPIRGASVTAWSHKQQKIGTAKTNEEGLVAFRELPENLGRPAVAVVEKGDDYTFLELKPRQGKHNIGSGLEEFNPEKYDGFIYTDRDLYRPGETIHLRFIGRIQVGLAPLVDVPLQVVITQPNGKKLQSSTVRFSTLGTASLDLETGKEYPTGKYSVHLKVPGRKAAIATAAFQIETYVPARMRANTQISEPVWKAGKEYAIHVEAEQLHGGSAPNRRVDGILIFEKVDQIPGYADYRFGNASGATPSVIGLGETETDQEGHARFTIRMERDPEVQTPLKVVALTHAYELGGRRVTSAADALYLSDDLLLGIQLAEGEAPSSVQANVIALQAEGMTPATTQTVQVSLERMTWRYYMRRYYDYYGSTWERDYEPVETRQVGLENGKASLTFEGIAYGGYRIRVASKETPMAAEQTFRKNWRGTGLELTEETSKDIIQTRLDKPIYAPGEKARMTILSPFDGRAVVVVQAADIKRMFTAELTDGKCQVEIPITEADQPNIWAEVTAIHTPQKDTFEGFPYAAFNVQDIRVRSAAARLNLSVTGLPEKMEPRTTLTLTIETTNGLDEAVPAECTVALVDEGIHLLSNYHRPDPAGYIFRSRKPHALLRAHYYDFVAYDYSAPAAGGDSPGDRNGLNPEELQKRLGAERENWIKSIALWSGVISTGENGKAEIEVAIPEFTGQLRLVAVAASEKSAASHESRVYVKRPYMLRTSLPRYLLTGDEATCRATVFNTTDAACDATIAWKSVNIKAEGSRKVHIPAGGEASVPVVVYAGNLPASGSIDWTVEIEPGGDLPPRTLRQSAALPVNSPAHLFQSAFTSVQLMPGEKRVFENTAFGDDERLEAKILVSTNPLLRLHRALEFLIGYPYGCVEQTTSRCFPLFVLRPSKDFLNTAIEKDNQVDFMVQFGINRLFAMQTRDGGIGYWPGSDSAYPHGSIYAAHFLTHAWKSREFEMDAAAFDALLQYVKSLAEDAGNKETSDLFLRAYATYVLALNGDSEAPALIESFDNIPQIPMSGRYLLATALALTTRDAGKVRAYMRNYPGMQWPQPQSGGTLHSNLREQALHLMALRAAEAPEKEIHDLAMEMLKVIENTGNRWELTTHESAFLLIAVGDYLSDYVRQREAEGEGQGIAIAWNEGSETLFGAGVFLQKRNGPGTRFTVENKGTGIVHIQWTLKGIPENMSLEALQQDLSVSRVFLDKEGNKTPSLAFRQTESVLVGIEIRPDVDAENVIVADLLPAGLEVENPRLAGESLLRLGLESARPDYMDLRDDRLILFFDKLEAEKTYEYYYVATPVTPGRFTYPPVQAECMYDSGVIGRSAPAEIAVQE